jgi:REP element-mobilizing transposase RayT
MNYNPNLHHRRSIRLKGYDYAREGLYFITICCQNRACLFGDVVVGTNPGGLREMKLNDAGKMIVTEWLALSERFTNVELHEFVTMPNHFHGILEIVGESGNNGATENKGATTDNGATAINRATTRVAPTGDNGDVTVGAPLVGAHNAAHHSDHNINNDVTKNDMSDHDSPPTNKTIGDMMDAFKSITTVKYINGVKTLGWPRFDGKIWQRNYHEHIIRNEKSYLKISQYIVDNPAKWDDDKFYMA